MGIWAHPDDEAFGTAGTMARAVSGGHPVAVVSATRGEAGKIADPALATQENLGQVRERELRNACAAVGVHDVSFLDYVDGHLHEADPYEAIGRVVRQLRRFRPDVVMTFPANGGYGHLDHMAIHRFTLAALESAASDQQYPEQLAEGLRPHRVRKIYFGAFPRERMIAMREELRKQGQDFVPGGDAGTIPFEEMGTPMAEITTTIVLNDAEFDAKLRALTAHATQMPADSPWAHATPEQTREFMGTEVFQLVAPPISDQAYPTPEHDIFAGL
jgi:LmbE family N-acetylglucosaminyl deacetylase